MSDSQASRGVIPAGSVHRADHSVVVDSADSVQRQHDLAMSVIPLLDENQVVGLEVRCSCGTATIIECVYDGAPTTAASVAAQGRVS